MRILFAHDHPFTVSEGAVYSPGKLPYRAWQRYLEHFDDLTVLARSTSSARTESLERADGPNVDFMLVPRALRTWDHLLFPRRARAMVREAVSIADAVVARVPSTLGRLAVEEARRQGKPYAVEVVACAWLAYWNKGGLAARVGAPIEYWRMRRLVGNSKRALYVSQRHLQTLYPMQGVSASASNVSVKVPPVVNAERMRVARSNTIGMIATLDVNYKGIDTAIEALSILHKRGIVAQLRILGEGSRQRWQAFASARGVADAVHFDGTRPGGEQVAAWLSDLDLYMQPSRMEGVPRAMIEAMAAGVPCVGSTAGGTPELLDALDLHRPGDAAALARLLENGLTNSEWRVDRVQRNHALSLSFDHTRLAAIRSEFYHGLAQQARRAPAFPRLMQSELQHS